MNPLRHILFFQTVVVLLSIFASFTVASSLDSANVRSGMVSNSLDVSGSDIGGVSLAEEGIPTSDANSVYTKKYHSHELSTNDKFSRKSIDDITSFAEKQILALPSGSDLILAVNFGFHSNSRGRKLFSHLTAMLSNVDEGSTKYLSIPDASEEFFGSIGARYDINDALTLRIFGSSSKFCLGYMNKMTLMDGGNSILKAIQGYFDGLQFSVSPYQKNIILIADDLSDLQVNN